MSTTSTLVGQLIDIIVARLVPDADPSDVAAAKSELTPEFLGWVGGAEALPAASVLKTLEAIGVFQEHEMERVDYLTGAADGGPDPTKPGWYPLTDATGTTTLQPGLQRLKVDAKGIDPKGYVATFGDLPGTAVAGDGWVVLADGKMYVRAEGGTWTDMGPWRGATGASAGQEFTFVSGATDADPGSGGLKVIAGFILADNNNRGGASVTAFVDAIGAGDTAVRSQVTVRQLDSLKVLTGNVTGPIIDAGGYRKIPVTIVGTTPTFDAGATLVLSVGFTTASLAEVAAAAAAAVTATGQLNTGLANAEAALVLANDVIADGAAILAAADTAVTSAAALSGSVTRVASHEQALSVGTELLGFRESNTLDWIVSANLYSLSVGQDVGTDIAVGAILKSFSTYLQVTSSAAKIYLKVWERSASSPNLNAGPGAVGDILVDTVEIDIGDTVLAPDAAGLQLVEIPLTAELTAGESTVILAEFGSMDGSGTRIVTGFGRNTAAPAEQRRKGFFRISAGGSWNNVTSSVPWFWNGHAYLDGLAVEDGQVLATNIANSFTPSQEAVAVRAYNSQDFNHTAGTFYGYSFGLDVGPDVAADASFDTLNVRLQPTATTSQILLRMWSRPAASPNLESPPPQSDDTPVLERYVSTASLGLVADTFGDAAIPLGQTLRAEAGQVYLFLIEGLTSALAKTELGIGRADPTGLTQHRRGWYSAAANLYPVTGISAAGALCWTLSGKRYTDTVARAEIVSVGGDLAAVQDALLDLETEVASLQGGSTTLTTRVERLEDVPLVPTKGSRIGIGGHIGRVEHVFNNATPKTWRNIFTLPQHIDAVQIIFAHAGASEISVARAAVAPLASAANFALEGVTWTSAKFKGQNGGTLPARPAPARRAYLVSDWIAVSSLRRTDDANALPLLAVSAYIDTAGDLTIQNNAALSYDYTNWASHPVRPRVIRYNDGDCVTAPASFASTTNRSTSPIVAIRYLARGQVISTCAVGDSITNGEGSGITYYGATAVFEACKELSDINGVAYDFLNLGWSGCTSDKIRDHMLDALAAGIIPDVVFYSIYSPNDMGTPITDPSIAALWTRHGQAVTELEKHGVQTVLWTGIPTNAAIKNFGTSDSKRRDFNDLVRQIGGRGVVVADFDLVMQGTTSGGQVQMAPGSTSDNIHPNDAGIQLMKPLAKNALLALDLAQPAALITA